jgi:hypothetical protein
MSSGRRVVLGCRRWSTSCVLVLIQAAPVVLIIFALLLPANAQFWGNSGGWRQQQPYNPYGGGFGGNRQWDYWGYQQRERAPSPRVRERPREVEKEQPPDYSHAPPATPRKDATLKIVVMGDANADWLAYGLEDALSEKPEIGIVRKHRTDSGLIRYDQRRDSEWPQVAREIITAEKPKFIVMMIGNNDRQTIREKAPPPAPANAQPIQPPPPVPPSRPDLERQPVQQQPSHLPPAQARQEAYGPWEFQSEKWEYAYIKRIDATIAALKSAGVPVIWVGLPSQRGTNASDESSYLNGLYRSQAEKAGIVYVDIWTALSMRRGSFRHKDRITWDRLADYGVATASILRSSVRVSLRFTSSAKSSASSATRACRSRCQCPSVRARKRRMPKRAARRNGRQPGRSCRSRKRALRRKN